MSPRESLVKEQLLKVDFCILMVLLLVPFVSLLLNISSKPEIEYIADTRSDLCYAYKKDDMSALTKVPCSTLVGLKVLVVK